VKQEVVMAKSAVGKLVKATFANPKLAGADVTVSVAVAANGDIAVRPTSAHVKLGSTVQWITAGGEVPLLVVFRDGDVLGSPALEDKGLPPGRAELRTDAGGRTEIVKTRKKGVFSYEIAIARKGRDGVYRISADFHSPVIIIE
jgi:plastocyanin